MKKYKRKIVMPPKYCYHCEYAKYSMISGLICKKYREPISTGKPKKFCKIQEQGKGGGK